MFRWFEREGQHVRLEILNLPTGEYKLRVINENGSDQIEHFTNATDLAKRQEEIQHALASQGWTGRVRWVL
jgi:hypothetical protein